VQVVQQHHQQQAAAINTIYIITLAEFFITIKVAVKHLIQCNLCANNSKSPLFIIGIIIIIIIT